MHVLVDASSAFDQGAGIGRYARNVLTSTAARMTDARWTLLRFPERFGKPPFPFDRHGVWCQAKVSRRTVPLSRRRADQLFFRLRLPLDLRVTSGPADVIYSPDFTAPPAGRMPAIVTIHDLAFLTHPEWAPHALTRYLTGVVPAQVRRARAVAVVSEATRQDVLTYLNVDAERVHLVRNGVEDRFFSAAPLTAAERRALGIPEQYLLTVGTIEPRKNHLTMFQAMDALPRSLRLPLVVAGRRGWAYEPVLAAAAPLLAEGKVVLLDYVPEEWLPSLYAGAAAVVYPSWTEGFGLPVIEGLAAGVPVVTGSAPALREAGGDAAVYAMPSSPESVSDAIETALSSADGERRRRGQEHARRFTWDRAGAQLAELLCSSARIDA